MNKDSYTTTVRDALVDALSSLDTRLRACMSDPITAREAYDSFYQEIVAEALQRARSEPEHGEAGFCSSCGRSASKEMAEACGQDPCHLRHGFKDAANIVLELRSRTVMSKYASQRECQAARDILWEAACVLAEQDRSRATPLLAAEQQK